MTVVNIHTGQRWHAVGSALDWLDVVRQVDEGL
jgi:hypothetical protein